MGERLKRLRELFSNGLVGPAKGIYLMSGATGVGGILLVTIAVRGHASGAAFVDAFILELGMALLIAAILALTIDGYMRAHAAREQAERQAAIEENIFRHLFGFGVQPAVVDELTETIFNSKVMRERLRMQYEFSSLGASELVAVRLTVSYIAVNTSRSSLELPIHHYFENVIDTSSGPDDFVGLEIRGAGHDFSINRHELKRYITRTGIRRILQYPAVRTPPGQRLRVRYSYATVRRRADSEVWITTFPASGLRLMVILGDDAVSNLAFTPDASHRNEPEVVSGGIAAAGSRILEWRMGDGLLPYQGVVLYWCPLDNLRALSNHRR